MQAADPQAWRRPGGREHLAFSIAVALVAVVTVVDAFVAPAGGTAWSDHLASGLVPLALLAAAAGLYSRLRPGARAAVAGVIGVLAIEGAALASVGVARGTARAVDWVSSSLWVAGVVLLSLAVLVLWRSRKPTGRRHLRRGLVLVGALAGAYVVFLPVAMALYAVNRPRAAVSEADLGAPHRAVTVRTADGLDLAAWYVPSRNGAAVISFPTRAGKPEHARMLVRHGFGVLLVDMRGYDGSEGAPNAFGWGAAKDIDAAVAWLRRRPDVHEGRIGGIGFSVGGEQMVEAAAGNPALRAVVADGAGVRSVREAMLYGWKGLLYVPSVAVQTAALTILSDTTPPPGLDDLAAMVAPRALFLIHAGKGGGGEELNPDFYEAAGQPKAIWRIAEAGHGGGLASRPAEYERRVIGFFERTLLRNGG